MGWGHAQAHHRGCRNWFRWALCSEQLHSKPLVRVCVETLGGAASGPRSPLCGFGLQVDGRKHASLEDGIQVVVIDGRQGHVLRHTSFRNAILQGIPWQLFSYVAAIPDK